MQVLDRYIVRGIRMCLVRDVSGALAEIPSALQSLGAALTLHDLPTAIVAGASEASVDALYVDPSADFRDDDWL